MNSCCYWSRVKVSDWMATFFAMKKSLKFFSRQVDDARLYNVISRTLHQTLRESIQDSSVTTTLEGIQQSIQKKLFILCIDMMDQFSLLPLSSDIIDYIFRLFIDDLNEDLAKCIDLSISLNNKIREKSWQEHFEVVQDEGKVGGKHTRRWTIRSSVTSKLHLG